MGRDQVANILLAHGVEEDSTLPRKRSLTLQRVLFRGTKHDEEKPFEFLWDGLGNGIWGLLTDANSKGKSSILGLVRGALRGELPGSRLKPDVWGWLSEFELDFHIDEHAHRIRLTKPAGATEAEAAVATLSRFDDGRELVIKRGMPDDAFGQAVDSLFMDELGFSRVRAFRAREGEPLNTAGRPCAPRSSSPAPATLCSATPLWTPSICALCSSSSDCLGSRRTPARPPA